jgi:hypothetical protein
VQLTSTLKIVLVEKYRFRDVASSGAVVVDSGETLELRGLLVAGLAKDLKIDS